ncbi:ubiquitin-conjugating enzyme E2 W [Coemansia sp. RSA 2131]|nr:ubiquitin-conjugating enzyme E2 W [Coemansia sp. RSA 2131]
MPPLRTKRLLRELRQLKATPTPNFLLEDSDSIDKWTVRLRGAQDTLYENEEYMLLFEFPAEYPLEAPMVVFTGEKRPERDKVYVKQASKSPRDTIWLFDDTMV